MTWKCLSCGKLYSEQENTGGLSAGKAAIGAVVAGPAGAIVGAAMGKKTRNDCCPYCGSTIREDAMLANAKAAANLVSGPNHVVPKYEKTSDSKAETAQSQQMPVQGPSGLYTAESATKRAFQFLEDGEYDRANKYAEAALDVDPEYGDAYVVKLLCEFEISSIDELGKSGRLHGNINAIRDHKLYKRALRYCDPEESAQLNNQLALREEAESDYSNQVKAIHQLNGNTPEGWSLFDVAFMQFSKFQACAILTPNGELLDRRGKKFEIDSQGHYVAIVNQGSEVFLLKDDGTVECIRLCQRDDIDLMFLKVDDSPCAKWRNIVSLGFLGLIYRSGGLLIGITATGNINYFSKTLDSEQLERVRSSIALLSDREIKPIAIRKIIGGWALISTDKGLCALNLLGGELEMVDERIALNEDRILCALHMLHGECEMIDENKPKQSVVSYYIETDDYEYWWYLDDNGTLIRAEIENKHIVNNESSGWTSVVKCFGVPSNSIQRKFVEDYIRSNKSKPLYGIRADGTIEYLSDKLYFDKANMLEGLTVFESIEELEHRVKELTELRIKLVKKARENEAEEKKKAEAARKRAKKKANKEKLIAERKASGLCQHCGGIFKGIFKKTCKECGKPKDY